MTTPPKIAAVKIERMALADLRPHPANPRVHPLPGTPEWEALKKSLLHDYYDLIVFCIRCGRLVSGHLRVKVLAAEGYTHADVSVVDYDEPTHLARMLSANKSAGENDLPRLKDVLETLDVGDFDMALTGFIETELENMMTAFPPDAQDEKTVTCPKCGEIFVPKTRIET
jgi:hypothetical protein